MGQLVREKWGLEASYAVGFTTHSGWVSAAKRWDGDREEMALTPALAGSYEDVLHRVALTRRMEEEGKRGGKGEEKEGVGEGEGGMDFALLLRSNGSTQVHQPAVQALERPMRLERAVGVQYVKRTERQSHYIQCCLPQQFDYVIHVDVSHALVSATHAAASSPCTRCCA